MTSAPTVELAPPAEYEAEPEHVEPDAPKASPEQLALPAIDGEAPDRIEVQFAGGVRLDRSDPADCALMRQLALGQEVTLRVVGVVASKNGKIAWDEDGYPGETTHVAKVRVTTVYRAIGEGTEARVGESQTDLVGTVEAG
jgi:hypothetical protein